MALLRGISDRFWNYVSPRKTQQRREKPFKVPAVPIRRYKTPSSPTKALSPETLITNWDLRTPAASPSADATKLPPSPPTSLERAYTDYDGDTLLDGLTEHMNIAEDDTWDANEETMVVDEAEYIEQQKTIKPDAERKRREHQGQDLRAAGWTEDAIFLFQKLGMRGFEALMPGGWVDDFVMLPVNLFTTNIDKAFIKPAFGSDFHAQKAISDIFNIGPRARDAVLTRAPIRTPEFHIHRGIQQYEQWALRDGRLEDVWGNLSVFQIVSARKDTAPALVEQKMVRKLRKLANQWRDAFNVQEPSSSDASAPDLPTLYGVITSHTIMAFVSYDMNAIAPSLRTVAMFDFGQEGYDVWNSLAIAIFVIHCRNRLTDLKDFLPRSQLPTESDRDL
ncbi:hypothetical protein BDV95DRAFT_489426 [Massariosphaeria phaeospora]|uniref:Uncharacterized protein n=1 Tax=Massariosphaeria phaeospora TaxID=100035 RepID=A0A7C8M8K1_9PLEO|nr:hypothetical protein BDV95DRAFT_489426 [Massariosphaeria phaeospora]